MAKASSIGGIFAELSLRDSKFTKGMKGVGGKLKAFGAGAAKYGAMAGAALGAGMMVGAKRIISMGAELNHLSTQTGVAVGDLMKIRQAYKDNGKSAESAGKDINKMQRAIFEASQDPGGSVDFFAQMGLDANKLMGMTAAQQFETIGKAINGIGNQTKRAALTMDIFGRGAGQLLTVFSGSSMEDVNRSLGRMPEVMQEFSAELERADTLIGRLPNKSDQFFTGFTTGVINNILPTLEQIDNYDFTNVGLSLGNSLSKGIMDASSHLAIFANSAIDFFSGENFNFMESMEKYAAAQVAIENDDDQARSELRRQAEEDAAYQKARLDEHRSAPDFIDPASIAPAATIQSIKNAGITSGFDSYRARGLSMSANPSADSEKKQLDVQIKIHRILERFTQSGDGTLNWA